MSEEIKNQEPARNSAAEKGHVEHNLPETMPRYCLVPGDPNRVTLMASQWDEGAEIYDLARQERAAIGTYKGSPIAAHDTGMGGPSVEIYLMDLMERGVDTFIRVGTTGAIQPGIKCGDIIINDASVRYDGTSDMYVCKEFPAAAHYEVTTALIEAAERLGYTYHVGTGVTCSSFFTGQSREVMGYRPSWLDDRFNDMRQAGCLNYEMESATVLTLARVLGKRAGMCAVVVAHRLTGEWMEDPEAEAKACILGAEALKILAERDAAKKK